MAPYGVIRPQCANSPYFNNPSTDVDDSITCEMHIDGLVQACIISIANALQTLQSCTIWSHRYIEYVMDDSDL